jgi:hypothetical protein
MELLKRVVKKSLFIIIPAIIISFFYARNVEGLVGTEKATAKLMVLSMFRLLALFGVIFLLIYYKVVNVFGLLFGFTVVFILILIEGAKVGKRN